MQFIKSLPAIATDYRRKTGRPFVTLSFAQSLDGCISGRPGEGLALSSRQSLVLTHRLRASHDAILVGIGTVFSDNPRLNVRLVDGRSPQPIVVDSRLRIPSDCKLFTENHREVWVVTGENPDPDRRRALERVGARVLTMPAAAGGLVRLDKMLERLGELGINSIMVEGGSRIITNFILGRLANSVVMTMVPVILSGVRGVRDISTGGLGIPPHLGNWGYKRLGQDVIFWGDFAWS